MNSFQTPVLFIVFNRPDVTREVFKKIKKIRPSTLYISADGARKNVKGEQKKCEQTRAIVDEIDWECDLHTLFRDHNLGCRKAVSGAIDWLFKNEEEGIILEDDCVVDLSFFRFCDELLDRYAAEEKVMSICAENIQPERRTPNSYYFSRHMHCWGWASWRRAWKHYDVAMNSWPKEKKKGSVLEHYFNDPKGIEFWKKKFDQMYQGEVDTWDHQWVYAIWQNSGLNIIPEKNLVSNIGFGRGATHTRNFFSSRSKKTTKSLDFPLQHPEEIKMHKTADQYTQRNSFYEPLYRKVLKKAVGLFK
jgi:hypothetical protein